VLLGADVTTDAVRAEVRTLLGEARYPEAAAEVAEEIRNMPEPGEAVKSLERLIEER
jgi:UDP:flavonoid glycosyltransferase YjiC (YdhE family)